MKNNKLIPYAKNPRQITDKRNLTLDDDMRELGDIGLIVHDWNSGEIIDGNQRTRLLDLFDSSFEDLVKSKKLVIFKEFEKPDKQGTVALGFINHPQKGWFGYRGVKWDKRKRDKANIKGNLHAGDFDFDILANEFDAKDLFDFGFDDDFLRVLNHNANNLREMMQSENEIDYEKEWEGMPDYQGENSKNRKAYKGLHIYFQTKKNYDDFIKTIKNKIDSNITEKTKTIWYSNPPIPQNYVIVDENE